ncbi:MAG: DUF4115 domain-containing protein, partial [Gammaproteobacteria bacterium]|nr:DUF4115 domain-containing protein [Gammaproteobacteria bacterium]
TAPPGPPAPATPPPSTTAPAATPPSTTAPATTPPSTTAPATTPPSTTAPAATLPSTTAPAATRPSTTAPVATPAAPPLASKAADPASEPPTRGELIVSTTSDSWVAITDAKGRRLWSGTLKKGKTVGVTGSPPYALLIGNAPAVTLSFRGNSVDVQSHTLSGVARLSVGVSP